MTPERPSPPPTDAGSPVEGPPRAREDVVFRRVGEDWLLFDPRTGRIHVLNLTAALVWSYCTGEHDVEAIGREVREAFADGVTGDPVADALDRFRREGLLVDGS